MSALHDQIDVSAEVTLEETLEQWRLSTAFCHEKFKKLYNRPEWKALASAAQSLMCVAQTAAAANDVDGCLKILDMIVKYSAVDVSFLIVMTSLCFLIFFLKTPQTTGLQINLGPTTRQNAMMSMLALTVPSLLPVDAAAQLEAALASASEDDDRVRQAPEAVAKQNF